MSRLDDIKEKERAWAAAYKEYTESANRIDSEIESISNKISSEISTINTLKEILEPQIRILYQFLNGLGNVSQLPNYTTLKRETFDGYAPKSYLLTTNSQSYMNEKDIGKVKEWGRSVKDFAFYGASGKFSGPALKAAYQLAVVNFEKEKMDWENDKGERNDFLNNFKLQLQIAELYHKVFSIVKDAMERVIIPELPGITAFLYAQGVKDAIISGKIPSQSKPVPIKRFLKSTAYSRHVNFVKNVSDFYVLFKHYYENDYLTQLFNTKDMSELSRKEQQLKTKVLSLENNSVFGRKNG